MERADIAIIGTGPAGVSAAITATNSQGMNRLPQTSRARKSKQERKKQPKGSQKADLTDSRILQSTRGLPDIRQSFLIQFDFTVCIVYNNACVPKYKKGFRDLQFMKEDQAWLRNPLKTGRSR